nr:Dolichyl-phosphate-mannose-protein mannosyltransferase [uncultured organism]
MSTTRHLLQKPWIYLTVIIIGTLLKFHHLDRKLFWRDEISSVLYVSGIKYHRSIIPINQIKNKEFYENILQLSNKPYSLTSEITGILSDTHLTPAHYIFLTVWYRLAGDRDIDYRLFSVFIFIISIPFLFLLTKTLFNSNLPAWIATSLFTISPFINFEAQEARYYILWVFCFIVSNYLFLKCINKNKIFWWVGYSLVSILALYTSTLSFLFILGHFIYTLLLRRELWPKAFLCLVFISLAYLPWIYFLYTVRDTITSGLAWHKFSHSSLFSLDLIFFQLAGLTKSFIYLFDINVYFTLLLGGGKTKQFYYSIIIDNAAIAFVLYTILYFFINASKEVKWFLLLNIVPLFLIFYLSDIFRDGFTSLLWRYQITNMVGISLIVTYLLYNKISEGKLFTRVFISH